MTKHAVVETLTTLSDELSSLEGRRARIDADISRIKAAIRALTVYLNEEQTAEGKSVGAENKQTRRKSRQFSENPGNSVSSTVRLLARTMMIDRGRPVTRAEILEAAIQAGIPIGGSQPEKTVSKILTRGKVPEFESFGQGKGYWPSDLPLANSD